MCSTFIFFSTFLFGATAAQPPGKRSSRSLVQRGGAPRQCFLPARRLMRPFDPAGVPPLCAFASGYEKGCVPARPSGTIGLQSGHYAGGTRLRSGLHECTGGSCQPKSVAGSTNVSVHLRSTIGIPGSRAFVKVENNSSAPAPRQGGRCFQRGHGGKFWIFK